MVDWIKRVGAIADRETDSAEERLRHRLLVYMALLMSCGGLLWGSLAAWFDLLLQAVIPYGYVLLTAVNLGWLARTKDFPRSRSVQVFLSLLLPFLFQWSLGGFAASGAMMLWAMLAIVGSHTFSTARSSLLWLSLYLLLTVLSAVLDPMLVASSEQRPAEVLTLFFLVNIICITSIVFGLTIWLLRSREQVMAELEKADSVNRRLNEELESQVVARTAELELALAETSATVDNLVDGLLAIDARGNIRTVNRAMGVLLGMSEDPEGSMGQSFPPVLVELALACVSSGEVVSEELTLAGRRVCAAVASPIGEDPVRGAVVIMRDVTLQKEVDRMKTDFIATVSHELRTPLTSVLGFAKLSLNKLEQTVGPALPADRKVRRAYDQISGNLRIVVSEGQRLTALINDVLDISKMEAGRMEWRRERVSLAGLVRRAVEASAMLFPPERPVRLITDIRDEGLEVLGDFDRLLQVLLNLLSNAGKFTEQGSVTVTVQRGSDGQATLKVVDTGEGIALVDQEGIFEKFRQVGDTLTEKPMGTGLGLPICSQIVRAHEGTIAVSSVRGQGATFTVELPLLAESGRALPRHSFAQQLAAEPVKRALEVLVVDDDPSLLELLRQQLGERGFTVRCVVDGLAAIRAVRERRPDLLILDVMLPELSGLDIAAVLRNDSSTSDLPILALSILPPEGRVDAGQVDGWLTKPAEPDAILSEVTRLVRSRSSHR